VASPPRAHSFLRRQRRNPPPTAAPFRLHRD